MEKMRPDDSERDREAIDWLERTQLRTHHNSLSLEDSEGAGFLASGGVEFHASDNIVGSRAVLLTARALRLGKVEVLVSLQTQRSGRMPHRKTVSLSATPEALRDLARELLKVADSAEERRPRPSPIR